MIFTTSLTKEFLYNCAHIKADNLSYAEIGDKYLLDCDKLENHSKIARRCKQISRLFKEIEELNK